MSSDDEDEPVIVRRKPVAVGGGGAVQPAAQQHTKQPEEEPLSPSMPVLYINPTFSTTAHQQPQPQPQTQPQQQPQQPQQLFSVIDMKDMLRMSLALMSPENAQRHKSQVKAKYGFDDTTI